VHGVNGMTDAIEQPLLPTTGGQRLIRGVRFLLGMYVAAAIFWYFGPWAARPVDPRGPITLLMVDQGVIGMAQLLGLGVIASGLAVAICGAGSSERGPLAVAVGLAALSFRGAQLDSLLLYRMTTLRPGQSPREIFPTWGLIAETWLWLALIAAGLVVGRWVESWFAPVPRRTAPAPTDVVRLLGAIVVSTLVSGFAMSHTMGGAQHGMVKGQICFAIVLAFMLGSLVAHWFFQNTSRTALQITVALVATYAYIFGAPDAATLEAAHKTGTYVTLQPLCRPLPIEFAAMGAIGILLEEDAMQFLKSLFGLQSNEEDSEPAP
jgi:hypothetical protein